MLSRAMAALLYIALVLSVLTYCTALTQEQDRLEAEKINECHEGQARQAGDG